MASDHQERVNLPELQRKLFAAARADVPSDRVPYAFPKRVMANLTSVAATDIWAFWSRALWRAAAPCAAVTLLLSAWSWFAPGSATSGDLSQDFENTVLAAAVQDSSTESAW